MNNSQISIFIIKKIKIIPIIPNIVFLCIKNAFCY